MKNVFKKSIKQTYIIVAFIINANPKQICSAVKIKVPLLTLIGQTENLYLKKKKSLILADISVNHLNL